MKLSFSVLWFLAVAGNASKVCVIGGGIAGASCAYFLNKNTSSASSPLDVVVLERSDRIGGRLYSILIDGARADLGGDAWTNANENMMHLIDELPIKIDNSSYVGNGKQGIYDGKQIISVDKWEPITDIKVLMEMEILKKHLKENFNITDAKGFLSIEDYVNVGISEYLNETAREWAERQQFNPFFINFLFEPLTRVIYDQNLDMTLFGAMVSLLSAERSYAAEDGNDSIVKDLLNKSNARVKMNSSVASFVYNNGSSSGEKMRDDRRRNNKDNDNNTTTTLLDSNGDVLESNCDAVVIAAPIEMTGLSFPSVIPRPFYHWWITIVAAKNFSSSYFGLSNGTEVPDNLLTLENSTAPFTACAVLAKGKSSKVYKCFSNANLTTSMINDMFEGVVDSFSHLFDNTFPEMRPGTNNFQPLVLDNGVIYVGGMESVAVAMEGSVISGKNAALLVKRKLEM